MNKIIPLIISLLTTGCSSMFNASNLSPNRTYQASQSTIKTDISKNKESVIKQAHEIVNNINKNMYDSLKINRADKYNLMVDNTLIIINEISKNIDEISYQGVIETNYHYYVIDNK